MSDWTDSAVQSFSNLTPYTVILTSHSYPCLWPGICGIRTRRTLYTFKTDRVVILAIGRGPRIQLFFRRMGDAAEIMLLRKKQDQNKRSAFSRIVGLPDKFTLFLSLLEKEIKGYKFKHISWWYYSLPECKEVKTLIFTNIALCKQQYSGRKFVHIWRHMWIFNSADSGIQSDSLRRCRGQVGPEVGNSPSAWCLLKDTAETTALGE